MRASELVVFNSLHLALSNPEQTPLVACVASVMWCIACLLAFQFLQFHYCVSSGAKWCGVSLCLSLLHMHQPTGHLSSFHCIHLKQLHPNANNRVLYCRWAAMASVYIYRKSKKVTWTPPNWHWLTVDAYRHISNDQWMSHRNQTPSDCLFFTVITWTTQTTGPFMHYVLLPVKYALLCPHSV